MAESRDMFRFLVLAALVDGHLSEEEKPVLLRAGARLGITSEQAGVIFREVAHGEQVTARVPADPAARKELFQSMIEVVAADGTLHSREVALFQRLAGRFGMTRDQLDPILQAVHAHLTETARLKAIEPEPSPADPPPPPPPPPAPPPPPPPPPPPAT